MKWVLWLEEHAHDSALHAFAFIFAFTAFSLLATVPVILIFALALKFGFQLVGATCEQ